MDLVNTALIVDVTNMTKTNVVTSHLWAVQYFRNISN